MHENHAYVELVAQAFARGLQEVLDEYRRRGIDGPSVIGPPEALAERAVLAALRPSAKGP